DGGRRVARGLTRKRHGRGDMVNTAVDWIGQPGSASSVGSVAGIDNIASVYLLRPPYRELARWSRVDAVLDLAPPRGSITVVRASPDTPWSELVAGVESLQRRFATCPVVIWAEGLAIDQIAALAGRGRMLGVRACLPCAEIDPSLLREVLTDLLGFPTDLTRWLENRGFVLTPRAREQLEDLAAHALDFHAFREFLGATGHEDGCLRGEFEKSGLGAPGRWFHLLRTLSVAIAIQAQPASLVSKLAERYGFYDSAHLRRRLDDIIGANPTVIRSHLSWEWMLFVALRRARIGLPVDSVRALASAQ
ncbi:MAG: hypothetical protein ACREM1_04825, partial [Longimicrobiales bacterium]